MGLDITAYQGLAFAGPGQGVDADGEVDYANQFFPLHVNPDYSARAWDLPNPCICSSLSDTMGFRAGGYRYYSNWRERLAQMAGYPAPPHHGASDKGARHSQGAWNAEGGPFWELISFSDCEGTIGPAVCAKLSEDFERLREAAQAFAALPEISDDDFMDNYESFAKAFKMGADGGAVQFH